MGTQMVRIPADTHIALSDLARDTGKPMIVVLAEAVREFQRRHLLIKTNEGYARLKEDPEAWQEEMEERALWERTIGDGLD